MNLKPYIDWLDKFAREHPRLTPTQRSRLQVIVGILLSCDKT